MKKKLYKKIGTNKSLVSSNSLWEAADHLLYCEYVGFEEAYKRFHYSNIQGVVVTRNNRSYIITAILLVFLVTFFLLWYAAWQHVSVMAIWIIFAFTVVLNIFKGDTCTTHIQTAVQQTNLRPLNRIKKVNRFFDRIRPHIKASQGELGLDILEEKYASTIAHQDRTPAADQLTENAETSESKGFQDSRWHLATFQLLIVMGVVEIFDFYYNHMAITIVSSILIMGFTIVGIIALVQHTRLRIKPAVKNITWATLGFGCLVYAMGYAMSMYIYATAGENGNMDLFESQSTLAFYKVVSEISPGDSQFIMVGSLIYLFGSMLLGTIGLLAYVGGKKSDAK